MFRLAHEQYVYGLALLPVLLIFFLWYLRWKANKRKSLGERILIQRLAPEVSLAKSWLKAILLLLAGVGLFLGLADPQVGTKLEEIKREGVDVFIALDISNSMAAQDVRPNRLERSKQIIIGLIDGLQNDRVGLIVFAGKAYLQLPLTTDFAAAKLFLSTIESDLIPTQGTAIGSAIRLARQSMDVKDNKHKVLIVITDGENHEDDALSETKSAVDEGVIVHTIGMGSENGGPIPIYKGNTMNYLKDQEGKVVVTKLNAGMLQQISTAGKGNFIRATNSTDAVGSLLNDINTMEKKNFGSKMYTDYEDRFQYFLGFAFVLLLLEFLMSEKKLAWFKKVDLFNVGTNKPL